MSYTKGPWQVNGTRVFGLDGFEIVDAEGVHRHEAHNPDKAHWSERYGVYYIDKPKTEEEANAPPNRRQSNAPRSLPGGTGTCGRHARTGQGAVTDGHQEGDGNGRRGGAMSRNWHSLCGCEHIGLSDEMAHTCADYPRCHEFKQPEPQPPYVPGPYREIFGVVGGGYDPCPICGAGRGELVRTYINGYGPSYEERGGCNHR